MNQQETAQVLAILRTVYSTIKIENPETMIKGWVWALGDLPANLVMKAAEIHAGSSKYFPTPAEIRKLIPRAEIIISSENKKLMPNAEQVKKIESKASGKSLPEYGSDEWLEGLCKFVGFGYPCDLDY